MDLKEMVLKIYEELQSENKNSLMKDMVLKIYEELRSENENSLMKELRSENENSLMKEMVLKIYEELWSENENSLMKELQSENENSLMKELRSENENSLKELRSENENSLKELRSKKENSLKELLRKNEPIFDRFLTEFVSQTPLHIAIQHGRVDFARDILRRNPQLAHVLSSQGFSPLHMASAKGSVGIIKELLPLIVDVSYDCDSKGWTPVHAAAMKGHVDLLKEFKRIKAEWIRDMTDQDETVLHLYVKYNNKVVELMDLRGLLGLDDDKEFVNRKDANGNTILHLAAMKKDMEMIRYLISTETGEEINAANMNGFTALDVFTPYPSNSADKDMVKELREKGAERSWEMSTEKWEMSTEKADNELKNVLLLVGTLTATLCFQASLVPPGGLWQDDSNMGFNNCTMGFNNSSDNKNHTAGTSILADKEPQMFLLFQTLNYFLFYVSLTLIVIGTKSVRPAFQWNMITPVHLILGALALVSCGIYLCNNFHTPKGFPHDIGQNLNVMYLMLFASSLFVCAICFVHHSMAQYHYRRSQRAAVRNRGSNVDTGNPQRS